MFQQKLGSKPKLGVLPFFAPMPTPEVIDTPKREYVPKFIKPLPKKKGKRNIELL